MATNNKDLCQGKKIEVPQNSDKKKTKTKEKNDVVPVRAEYDLGTKYPFKCKKLQCVGIDDLPPTLLDDLLDLEQELDQKSRKSKKK